MNNVLKYMHGQKACPKTYLMESSWHPWWSRDLITDKFAKEGLFAYDEDDTVSAQSHALMDNAVAYNVFHDPMMTSTNNRCIGVNVCMKIS